MHEEERRPERHELLVLACFAADGHVAEGVCRGVLSQQVHVHEPDDDPQSAGDAAPTHPREAEQEHLQRETDKDQNLDLPFVPEVQHSGHGHRLLGSFVLMNYQINQSLKHR